MTYGRISYGQAFGASTPEADLSIAILVTRYQSGVTEIIPLHQIEA
jgi:hypothetical protein